MAFGIQYAVNDTDTLFTIMYTEKKEFKHSNAIIISIDRVTKVSQGTLEQQDSPRMIE